MSFFTRISKAFNLIKKEESEERVRKLLTDDPITVETIAKIAKDFGYHFEVIQPDGTVVRFYKKGAEQSQESGVW